MSAAMVGWLRTTTLPRRSAGSAPWTTSAASSSSRPTRSGTMAGCETVIWWTADAVRPVESVTVNTTVVVPSSASPGAHVTRPDSGSTAGPPCAEYVSVSPASPSAPQTRLVEANPTTAVSAGPQVTAGADSGGRQNPATAASSLSRPAAAQARKQAS